MDCLGNTHLKGNLKNCGKTNLKFMMLTFQGSLEITQSTEDDPLLNAPTFPHHASRSQLKPRFHAIPTVLVANFLLLKHVAFVVLVFLAVMYCSYVNPNEDVCPGNYTSPLKVQSVIIIAKVILWILYVLFEHYVHYHHNEVNSSGQSTRHLKRLPSLIQSTGEMNQFEFFSFVGFGLTNLVN
uniref:Transmembrane protein 192 n=1 Tax=Pelusios castaneus TaxID=367368 RepID=A0A8C8SRT5_9SAUR